MVGRGNDGSRSRRPSDSRQKLLKNTEKEHLTKSQTISPNDPEAGWLHKGDHMQVFAYNIQTACDRNGWVLGYSVHPGNTHDTQAFPLIFEKVIPFNPKHVIADAGYKTPTIAQFLFKQEITPVFPYTRPRRKRENRNIIYDEYYDCYLDENDVVYRYTTTNRKGYREYKASSHDQKKYQNNRVITRHVWQEALETCEDIRHSDGM
ncbi:transposase [Facklamia sp. P13064]|uniref:transposase n=1 Tax=Facklamia sp. P13064 TaxID=3421953 RepID=UPI003D17F63A